MGDSISHNTYSYIHFNRRFLIWISAVFSIALSGMLITNTAQAADEALRDSLELEGGYPEIIVVGSTTAGANDVLYAGLNAPNGIFMSYDFGENWNTPADGSDFGTIIDVAVSDTPGTAFMIGGINLYRTQDNGLTWEELPDVQNVAQFFAAGTDGMLAVPTRDGEIYVSLDDGDSFTAYELNVTDVAVDANNTVVALVRDGEGDTTTVHFLTTDASAFTESSESGEYSIVMTHPTTAGYWVVAGSSSVRYTTGDAYTDMTVPEDVTMSLATIRANGDIYLGNSVSSDNGTTWTNAGGPRNWITFDEVNGYVYTQTERGVGRAETVDETFVDKVTGMTAVTVNDVSQDNSKEVVWLAVQGGFAKSENYASALANDEAPTWEFPIKPNDSIGSGSAVFVNPEDGNNVLAGTGSIFLSTDGGDTWTESAMNTVDQDNRPTIGEFTASDDGTVYATYYYTEGTSPQVGGGVLTSTDNGVTWTDMGLTDVPAGPIVALGNDFLIVGAGVEQDTTSTKRGIYTYNSTGGWEQLSIDSSDPTYGQLVNDLLYLPDSNLLVGISSGADMQGIIFSIVLGESEWSVIAENDIPSDFWGQGLAVNTNDSNQIYASTARPAGTGYIYTCLLAEDECKIYYTGLKDETFNTMLFDGLVTGSNAGLFNYKTNAKLAVKKKTKARKLIYTLKDAITGQKLSQKTIKLYRKIGTKKFRIYKKQKTNDKGQVMFKVRAKHGGTFQGRWKAKGADLASYNSPIQSKNKKFKKKKQ